MGSRKILFIHLFLTIQLLELILYSCDVNTRIIYYVFILLLHLNADVL